MSGFENLAAWKYARELRQSIAAVVKTFPSDERYRLSDQLIRASRSVSANISEGYGRYHYQETIQFCRQARGSMYECIDHLYCALDEGYIDRNQFESLNAQIQQCIKILNGYILFLKNQKNPPPDSVREMDCNYTTRSTYSTQSTYST